jgi:hypothetical protein
MSSLSFLYITQTAAGLPRIYECLRQKEFVLLSYKEKTPDTHVFLPKSTWTTGRNALREYVMSLEKQYDYYVFLDEDVVFDGYSQADGFNKLEELVNTYRPAIANPNLFNYYNNIIKGAEAQTTTWYDGMCNVFSREKLWSSDIFPYVSTYDSQSWWTSQYIMIILCSIYHIDVVLFSTLKVKNTMNSQYARGTSCFPDAEKYVFSLIDTTKYPDYKEWDKVMARNLPK